MLVLILLRRKQEAYMMLHSATFSSPGPTKVPLFNRKSILALLVLLLLVVAVLYTAFLVPRLTAVPSSPSSSFFASIDTMKSSRDTETHPLSHQEITNIVKLSASLHTNYITVDTLWEYSSYMKQWIDAIRATGRHVWFRGHPNQWENNNHTPGIMTLKQYEAAEKEFILQHASFFQPGDIFDACSEPEEGHYWKATYGSEWTSHAPNAATVEYNAFLRDTTDIANSTLHLKGIQGVITTIRSTNSFFATHPKVLEQATVNKFGYITVDSYPDQFTTDPTNAANARLKELQTIENIWHLPIVIGEMGYSNNVDVNDTTQQAVLKAEFEALVPLSYLAGVNYWVGAGTNTSGGYTHIFAVVNGIWSLRPAAHELSAFYQSKLCGHASAILTDRSIPSWLVALSLSVHLAGSFRSYKLLFDNC